MASYRNNGIINARVARAREQERLLAGRTASDPKPTRELTEREHLRQAGATNGFTVKASSPWRSSKSLARGWARPKQTPKTFQSGRSQAAMEILIERAERKQRLLDTVNGQFHRGEIEA